jgi:hypothetical protein
VNNDLEYAIDDCYTYITLAIDSIKEFRELHDLKYDLQTMLEVTRDKKREVTVNE